MFRPKARDSINQQRVKILSKREIIRSAQGIAAECVEGESRHAAGCLRHKEFAFQDFERDGRRCRVICKPSPRRVHRCVRCGAERRVVDGHSSHGLEAIIARAVEFDHLKPILDERDEGQKQLAIETSRVEIIRRRVGREHDDHARGQKLLEQASEDHGIGDVIDLKLIQAQKRGFGQNPFRHRRDRIIIRLADEFRPAASFTLRKIAPFVDALMRLGHELIEVHAPSTGGRRAFIEHIHQGRLAAADIAMDVEALGRVRYIAAKAKAEDTARPGPIDLQGAVKPIEHMSGARLCFVGLELAGVEPCPIAFDRRVRHRRLDVPFPPMPRA